MRSAVHLTQENARTALNTVKATGFVQGVGDFAYDTAVATAVLVYDTSLPGLFDKAARARNAARFGALIELAANIDELPAAIAASVETRMAEAARLSEAGDIRGANAVMGELSAEIGSFLLPGAGVAGVAGGVTAKAGAKAVADLSPKTQALLAKLSGGEVLDRATNRTADTYFGQQRQFWTDDPVQFNGNRVYQRNDQFDPNQVSTWRENGQVVQGTNLERMASGRAPIGNDGRPINLHHMTQTVGGAIAEVTQTFHQQNFGTIHINTGGLPSGINRAEFDAWRADYWRNRAGTWGQ